MTLPNLRPDAFLAAAQHVAEHWPDAELVKNQVGNLSIVDGGEYVGFIDLRTGDVESMEGT